MLRTLFALCSSLFLVVACADSTSVLPGDDEVLVRVDDTVISRYDLTRSLERTFGDPSGAGIDAEGQRKVLDALVTSRAIALSRERELDEEERAALERRVAAYREELLVEQYLGKHAPPKPVSEAAIETYYQQHRDRFGAAKVRRYELVTSDGALPAQQRDTVLKALVGAKNQTDWSAWVQTQRAAKLPVAHSRGLGNEAALHPRLRQLITALPPGQVSELTMIEGRPYLVRVTAVDELPVRPLSEVASEIRQILAPMQLRESIQTVRQTALKNVRVDYEQ
jgi:hypothetical protein